MLYSIDPLYMDQSLILVFTKLTKCSLSKTTTEQVQAISINPYYRTGCTLQTRFVGFKVRLRILFSLLSCNITNDDDEQVSGQI